MESGEEEKTTAQLFREFAESMQDANGQYIKGVFQKYDRAEVKRIAEMAISGKVTDKNFMTLKRFFGEHLERLSGNVMSIAAITNTDGPAIYNYLQKDQQFLLSELERLSKVPPKERQRLNKEGESEFYRLASNLWGDYFDLVSEKDKPDLFISSPSSESVDKELEDRLDKIYEKIDYNESSRGDGAQVYIAKEGDTVSELYNDNGIPFFKDRAQAEAYNLHIEDLDKIKPGDIIYAPGLKADIEEILAEPNMALQELGPASDFHPGVGVHPHQAFWDELKLRFDEKTRRNDEKWKIKDEQVRKEVEGVLHDENFAPFDDLQKLGAEERKKQLEEERIRAEEKRKEDELFIQQGLERTKEVQDEVNKALDRLYKSYNKESGIGDGSMPGNLSQPVSYLEQQYAPLPKAEVVAAQNVQVDHDQKARRMGELFNSEHSRRIDALVSEVSLARRDIAGVASQREMLNPMHGFAI